MRYRLWMRVNSLCAVIFVKRSMYSYLAMSLFVLTISAKSFSQETAPLLTLREPDAWTLFCPESLDGVDLSTLTEIPPVVGGSKAQEVVFKDRMYDVPRKASKAGPAVFMYTFESDAAGIMQAGAGADWFWSVMVNGAMVCDRSKAGNALKPISHRNHRFYFQVRKGMNLLIATVRRGSLGWTFSYGPVPFVIEEHGTLRENGLAQIEFFATKQDGTKISQSVDLRKISMNGTGKTFQLDGELADGISFSLASKEESKKAKYLISQTYNLKSKTVLPFRSAGVKIEFLSERMVHSGGESDAKANAARQIERKQKKSYRFTDPTQMLVVTSPVKTIETRRENGTTETLHLFFPISEACKATSLSVVFSPNIPPFKIMPRQNWVPLPFGSQVQPGSILDFSFLANAHAPAGKWGRIITNEKGHFSYETTGQRAKLVGSNLCFDANYPSAKEADALAERFRRQGYNAVRFHHTDVHLIQGVWNAQNSYQINPEALDKLDYLFAAMKKAGLYITIDFYTMRYFGPGEIDGFTKRVSGVVKSLLPVNKSAFQAWSKLVLQWMHHVNPYTGLAWKDDPALMYACPLNEDSIVSVLGNAPEAMERYMRLYGEWKTKQGLTEPDASNIRKDPKFARFLTEVKRESNRKLATFLKANGIHIPLSGSNWFSTMAQTFTRTEFDVVDNHQYADHPWNGNYNQGCSLRTNSVGRILPTFMMPTRIFGKPFTVTEFNFCFPNQYRAEAGALFGGYAALQDWDAVFRFAWSHAKKKSLTLHPISHFDIASDPVGRFTDRQISLLFARGDVSPASRSFVYAVSMPEATKEGCGGMWAGGLFPEEFSAMGTLSRIGSQTAERLAECLETYDGVVAETKPETPLPGKSPYRSLADCKALLQQNPAGEIVSDTGEIAYNNKSGYIRIVTAKTECMVLPPECTLLGNQLSIQKNTAFSSISASAMDEASLHASKRILLFHITNVLNTGMEFSNGEMRRIESIGQLPLLVRTGSAEIVLKNQNSDLTLYAINSGGTRIRTVPTEYIEGAYHFKVEIGHNDEAVLAYELSRK